jgi:hypothetical protein
MPAKLSPKRLRNGYWASSHAFRSLPKAKNVVVILEGVPREWISEDLKEALVTIFSAPNHLCCQ